MNKNIEKLITRIWYDKKYLLLAYLLFPFSLLYAGVVWLRCWCYQRPLRKVVKFNVPVIVVGNITVGGTGKTPLCIALCQFLQQQGLRPGIVARGYGYDLKGQVLVITPQQQMDEKLPDEALMCIRETDCPVAVATDRVAAARALLAQTDVNIIISDDGLQHYALARDLEIVMIDATRGLGNGFLLPAGPLRESAARLDTVACIVYQHENVPVPSVPDAITLIPQELVNVRNPSLRLPVDAFSTQPVVAMAGIGHPQRFFRSLGRCGYDNIQTQVFPDHHAFQASDFDRCKDAVIIMTEKDAVKCQKIAPESCWYLSVSVNLPAIVKARLVSDARFSSK